MTQSKHETLSGQILEEEFELSLGDLSRACCVHAEFVVELVDEGIIEPIDFEQPRWTFTGESLPRLRTAITLQRDLDLNLAGVALALELIQEIDALQAQLRRLPRDLEG